MSNINIYQNLFEQIKTKFATEEITADNMDWFKDSIGKNTLVKMINEILMNEDLLSKIADRSYTHALGFDKIVLMDLNKDCEEIDNKVQLRFHIWDNKNDALSVLEAMHEHSFNFISLVLTGKLENQCFDMKAVSKVELDLIEKLKFIVKNNSDESLRFLNEQVEIVEALKLRAFGSVMFDEQNLKEKYAPKKVQSLFNLNEEELHMLTAIEGHYVSNRVSGERDSYKHVLDSYKSINAVEVLSIKEGEYYFHPYQYPHRLYYDKDILNSTILLTTPVKDNPQGGSLQRMTYQKESEKEYAKIKLTKETLRVKLESYLNEMYGE